MKKLLIKIFVIFSFCALNLSAQTELSDSLSKGDNSSDTSAYVMTKSPLGAVLRSAVIPGWGQLYNHSYLKAPLIWGALGWFSYWWIWNNDKYLDYSDQYSKTVNAGLPNNNYKLNRDFYHDQRDLFAIYIIITYALNLLDAYVDAHLFDFNVEEDTRMKGAGFTLKIRF